MYQYNLCILLGRKQSIVPVQHAHWHEHAVYWLSLIHNSIILPQKLLRLVNGHQLYCRDQLKRSYNLNEYSLEVDLEDLRNFDEELTDKLVKQPTEYLPLVSILLSGIK